MDAKRSSSISRSALTTLVIVGLLAMSAFLALGIPLTRPHYLPQNSQVPVSAPSDSRIKNTRVLAALLSSDPQLDLGYGPTLLTPVSNEIPIYTIGDQMWMISNYSDSVSVSLFEQSTGTRLAQEMINPGTAVNFYTFGNLPTGILVLNVFDNGFQVFSTNVSFVNPSGSFIDSIVTQYSVNNGVLGISFNFSLANRYNVQECLSNQSLPSLKPLSEAVVNVPKGSGLGTIGISWSPGAALLDLTGAVSGAYTFQFELYANYSYSIPGSAGIVTRQLVAAYSDPFFIQARRGGAPFQTVMVTDQTAIRGGRYDLEAFFNNGTSIQGVNTRVVIPSPSSSSWFWLGACQISSVSSTPFLATANLAAGPPSGWPRNLYLMYQAGIGGMDLFRNVTLNLQISEVNFEASPWNVTLPDYIGISLANNSLSQQIEDVDFFAGIAFVISSSFPVQTNFALSFGGKTFSTASATIPNAYTSSLAYVPLSGIIVQVTSGSSTVPGAKVEVKDTTMENASAALFTDNHGKTQFYVPSGTYSIVVSDYGNSSTGSLVVSPEADPSYFVNFPPAPAAQSLMNLLIAATIVTVLGVAGNIWVWVIRKRRAISRL